MGDMVLVYGDARRETLIPSLKENLMLMRGYTITLTEFGQHGTLGMLDTVDMVLVSGDAKREMPTLSPKENLMLMPGYTITLTEFGQHGTLDMLDTVDMVLVSGDARREKLTQYLMLTPKQKLTTSFTVTGQPDMLATTALMDSTTDTVPANNSHV